MKRWMTTLAALLGAGLTAQAVSAKDIAPDQAPPAWVAYATSAMDSITGWLNAEEAPAPRVRAVLDAGRPAPDQPTAPLVVKLWVDGKGTITKVDFATLGEAQADQDLHALLEGKQLPPPPRGMRLPMRLALQLPPPPSAEAAAPSAAATLH